MKKFLYPIMAVVATLGFSCSDDDITTVPVELDLGSLPVIMEISHEAQDVAIVVNSNTSYSVRKMEWIGEYKNWLTLKPATKATTESTVVFEAKGWEGIEPREADITIADIDNNVSRVVKIRQLARKSSMELVFTDYSPESNDDGIPVISVSEFGGEYHIEAATESAVVASLGAGASEWITLTKPVNENKIKVTVNTTRSIPATYFDYYDHRAATITIQTEDGLSVRKVIVEQAPRTPGLHIPVEGESLAELIRSEAAIVSSQLLDSIKIATSVALTTEDFDALATLGNMQALDLSEAAMEKIPQNAFNGISNLRSVILPDSGLRIIEESAFSGTGLTHIAPVSIAQQPGWAENPQMVIPDGVQIVAKNAFLNAGNSDKKERTLTIPASVGIIDEAAFKNIPLSAIIFKDTDRETITEPFLYGNETITRTMIGKQGFYSSTVKLSADLVIPDYVASIGESSFYNSFGATAATPRFTVTIGKNVSYIDKTVFYGCKDVKALIFKENTSPDAPELVLFDGAANEYTGAVYCMENITSLTIPGRLKKIPPYSFSRIIKLETIVFEEGVEEIGLSAFSTMAANGFRSITFPTTLKTIAKDAFKNATRFNGKNVYVPTAATIDSGAFTSPGPTFVRTDVRTESVAD